MGQASNGGFRNESGTLLENPANLPSAGCRYENNQRTVPSTVKQLIEYRILGVSRPKAEKGFSKELLEALDLIRSNEVVWDYVKTLVKSEERTRGSRAPGLD